jgi:hypothetical protein
MSFIEYYDKNRILLVIFPAHATDTLQPLYVAIFSPLSNAYTTQLGNSINSLMIDASEQQIKTQGRFGPESDNL